MFSQKSLCVLFNALCIIQCLKPCQSINSNAVRPTCRPVSKSHIQKLSRELFEAIVSNNENSTREVLKSEFINVNVKDPRLHRTALGWSIARRAEPVAQILLNDPRIDINKEDIGGNTPLILAVTAGLTTITTKLVEHPKIKINRRGPKRMQAVMIAASRENNPTLPILLRHPHIKLNGQNENGQTPLMIASMCGNTHNVARFLSVAQTDPNIQDLMGYTAIMHAIRYNYAETVDALLKSPTHIDLSLRNNEGKTAFDLAIPGSATERILHKYNAQPQADSCPALC